MPIDDIFFMAKDSTTEAMVIGDSNTNRIDGRQIGPSILRRAFGGYRISGLFERTANIRTKKLNHVTILMRINECLSADFDIFESFAPYKKLIYTFAYKFI